MTLHIPRVRGLSFLLPAPFKVVQLSPLPLARGEDTLPHNDNRAAFPSPTMSLLKPMAVGLFPANVDHAQGSLTPTSAKDSLSK